MSLLRKIISFFGSSEAAERQSTCDALIEAFLREHPAPERNAWREAPAPRKSVAGTQILALDCEQQAEMVGALVSRLGKLDQEIREFRAKLPEGVKRSNPHMEPGWFDICYPRSSLNKLLESLLRRKLPLGSERLAALATWCASCEFLTTSYLVARVASAAEDVADTSALEPAAVEALKSLLKKIEANPYSKDLRKSKELIEKVLGQALEIPIRGGEVWSDAAIADIAALPPPKQTAWAELLGLCQTKSGSQPSAKWLANAENILANLLTKEEFKRSVLRWFPLVDKPRAEGVLIAGGRSIHPLHISNLHADILRGLTWTCAFFEDKEIARALGNLAISSYKKIPGVGPRLTRVGNACVHALGVMPGMDGVGQLALLRVKVKFGTAQKMLEKAFEDAAQRLGLPKDDLEEMAVPAYGMTEVGKVSLSFVDITAELSVPDGKTTEVIWKNGAGKVQRSIPAKVKSDFGEDLKELKLAEKDIQKMLRAQVERIDQLYLQQKDWPLDLWRERYLNHPLVGVIARRLIWRFRHGSETREGLWQNGAIADRHGHPLDLPAETRVALWHPLDSTHDEIEAWRLWLEEKEIRQPFKQAHREIYLLTPAEESTHSYSNRFAAHILKQHQFHALAGQRGWKNKLRLMVDDSYPPAHILLPKWNLRAEFWIEGAGTEYGRDTNESGTYLYLSTDQVRFYPIAAPQRQAHAGGGGYAPDRGRPDEPLPLAEIPALVFSEIMRDVDLFVGVASVANDPNWNDGGPSGRYVDYWHNQSFGELGASAHTRKAILERLIPRLKIASQCSFSDKFLVVKGQLRTYKIHLGSGNILMSPNDQYLCIVARLSVATPSSKVFLPFEGDNVMAVVISKAFLLAEDAKIKDETINRQIWPA